MANLNAIRASGWQKKIEFSLEMKKKLFLTDLDRVAIARKSRTYVGRKLFLYWKGWAQLSSYQ